MKFIVASLLFALGLVPVARADQFRFQETRNGSTFDVAYSSVIIRNGNVVVFTGRTDKFGRVTINLPNGQYEAQVQRGDGLNSVSLTIDGQLKLKVASLKS